MAVGFVRFLLSARFTPVAAHNKSESCCSLSSLSLNDLIDCLFQRASTTEVPPVLLGEGRLISCAMLVQNAGSMAAASRICLIMIYQF